MECVSCGAVQSQMELEEQESIFGNESDSDITY